MTKPPSSLRVLGLDPGFASVGWAVLSVEDGLPDCIAAGVYRSGRDASLAKNVDTLNRIQRLADFLTDTCAYFEPHVIGCESMSWTRFANADRSVAFFWGALGSCTQCPIVQTTPSDLKLLIAGKKSASKEDVTLHACAKVTNLDQALNGIRAKTQRNHASDAAAAALAALSSPIGKLALAMRS
jgi:Holliday junction resolvasome RuvABC endonuclease subunit